MAPPFASPPYLQQNLSSQQCLAYEHLAASTVGRTIAQYTKHLHTTTPIDANVWKLIKSRDGVKIYRSRERLQPNVFIDPLSEATPRLGLPRWAPASTILCVGTLEGTIEDAMYGSVTPTEHAMVTRSTIIQDEFIQHRVLQDIRLPTVDEPFQYVGLKWALRASKLASIVKSRDVVYVEASGFRTMATRNGQERVGFLVNHSVEPSQLVAPPTKGAIRARYSLSAIFRQKEAGVVEIYATITSDPGGSLPPKLAALSAAGALIAASNVMECALNKKLARLLEAHDQEEDRHTRVAVAKVRGSDWYCLQCTRSLSTFNSLNACEMCSSTVCSRCITSHKLVLTNEADQIVHRAVDVCNGCVSKANKTNATRAAMDEFVLDRTQCDDRRQTVDDWKSDSEVHFSETTSTKQSSPNVALAEGPLSFVSSETCISEDGELERTYFKMPQSMRSNRGTSLSEDDASELERTYFRIPESIVSTRSGRAFSLPEEEVDIDIDEFEEEEEDTDSEEIELIEPMPVHENTRQRLLRQMNALRIQAEETYYYTKHQSYTKHHSSRSFDHVPSETDIAARHAKRSLSRSMSSL